MINNNRTTRSIVLSKYIKIIKAFGFGFMDNVRSFRIEEGSCLESIEKNGLTHMSWKNTSEDARRSILVLPSTVTSIAENGLYCNTLIKTIYYCGSTHLSNFSDLEWGEVSAPDIKVTRSYEYDKIFESYTPNTTSSSIAEAEEICDKYKPKATPSQTYSTSPTLSPSPLPSPSLTKAGTIISVYTKYLAATYLIN